MMNIFPSYPRFREIDLKDKKVLNEAFRAYKPQISEYTFTNLYVWRESNKVCLSQFRDYILVKRKNLASDIFFLLPSIGNTKMVYVIEEILAIFGREKFPPVYGLNRMQAESLEKKGFTITEMRDNWDYVYLTENLINLPGERYYAKRKNIKKCLSDYKLEYEPITQEIIDQCLQLQTKWCNLKNCDVIPGLGAENRAIKETFEHFNDLNIFGGAILINGNVESFTIGEILNEETAVIHFEKANPDINGLYQVINKWFAQKTLRNYKYINREQDLGVSGLRRAKMSYYPAFFVEKYLARL